MSGMDMSLCPPADAITREEMARARAACPLCEGPLVGSEAVCRRCDNGDD